MRTDVPTTRRLIIGISGASGVVMGVRMLQLLREAGIETHLVISRGAQITLSYETDWKVRDVQIYPSRFGPSVEIAVDTKDMGLVSLFAIRPGTFDVVKPTVAPSGDISSAYFQIGEVAYAVVAKSGVHDLDRAAETLARTLY